MSEVFFQSGYLFLLFLQALFAVFIKVLHHHGTNGRVIYRFIIALALRANVPSECLKLISAVIVALAIAAPALKAKADFRRRRANAQKGGARHA